MSRRRSFRSRCRAQASTVGVALVIGMTLLGATAVVTLGAVAYDDGKDRSDVERAEQSMAQFDSRSAQVALGEDSTQRLALGRSDGTYTVDPDAGHLKIKHVNYDGSSNETVYETDLGAVYYRNGDREIAYQGGGVWRTDDADGNARMVSPPEFHYRAATLTLPVVVVQGSASAAGAPTAVMEQRTAAVAKYPNASATYSNGDEYLNPAKGGSIHVTVTGEYYEGWADYFDQRTDGTVVSVNDTEQSVTAKLITLGNQGQFAVPSDDGSDEVEVRGLQDGGLQELDFTLRPENPDSNKFSSLDWSMYVEEGDRRMEINLDGPSNGECGDKVDLNVYYTDDGGDTYHGWVAQDAYTITDDDGDCTTDDPVKLEVSLTDSSIDAEYETINGKMAQYNPSSGSLVDSVTFDEFDSDPDTDNTYTEGAGDTESIDVIVNHYFSHLGPRFNLLAADGNSGNTVSESDSTGDSIQYTGTDVITYLHVSENEVEVRFE
ncbi:hypothetical protein BRC94_11040 [Halobacteriales archaeon QS_5_70_17]|nr:MAG: hypothetical protein BRC94_11040 [Halobacteriales archaeon QS_5_70_17]